MPDPIRTALVTGGGARIGNAIVSDLAAHGWAVAIHANSSAEKAEAEVARITGNGGRAAVVQADLADLDAVHAILPEANDKLGPVTLLVNNAGIGLSTIREDYYVRNIKFWEVPDERWQTIFEVNARAAFLLSKAVVGYFLEQDWGRIVNVTTSMDTMTRRGWTPYGPSKAALEAQSACWSKDVADTGVTANVLVPGGPANTPMVPPESSPDRAAMVQPEVMKAPICWLMSNESDGFNGNRLTGTGWDLSLPGKAAAEKAAAPAAWPGAGQQSVWPDPFAHHG